jgi:hypothetical protein
MRTKTLLLTAVLGVAGVASTMAQSGAVYSQNAVGYVTLSLGAGFSIIANPLNAVTNDLNSILGGLPNGTAIYKFNPATEGYVLSTLLGGKWLPTDQVLNPGEAAFIKLAAPATVTFVGQVPQGSLTQTIPVGFSLQSLPIPVSVSLTNSLVSLKPTSGDAVYNFNNASQGYTLHTYLGGKFLPSDYVPAVGEGFFYKASAAITWNVNFSVN